MHFTPSHLLRVRRLSRSLRRASNLDVQQPKWQSPLDPFPLGTATGHPAVIPQMDVSNWVSLLKFGAQPIYSFEDFAECFPLYVESDKNGSSATFNSISEYIEAQNFVSSMESVRLARSHANFYSVTSISYSRTTISKKASTFYTKLSTTLRTERQGAMREMTHGKTT